MSDTVCITCGRKMIETKQQSRINPLFIQQMNSLREQI